MKNRILIPAFLKRFDNWLLKNKPATWSSRLHLLLYFAVIFWVIIALASFAAFSDARQYSTSDVWSSFIGLAAFTGFVVWLIFLLRFNVFKRFGNWKKWEGLRMFLLYFLNIAALVFAAFIPYIVECNVANNQYNDSELVTDMNEANLAICRLEYKLLPLEFKFDTIELVPKPEVVLTEDTAVTMNAVDNNGDSIAVASADETQQAEYRPYYRYINDTADFYSAVRNADSVVKVADSVYVTYECPDYLFARSYQADEHAAVRTLKSFDIYKKVVQQYAPPDRKALADKLKKIEKKYVTEYYAYNDYGNKTYTSIIEQKYFIREINQSIDNIARKKYWWKNDHETVIRVFWYISIVLTLLLFIFRNTTTKTFFLSLLTAVILLIVTGILIGVFRLYNKGIFVFTLCYYLVFLTTAILIKTARVRSAVQGIALNIAFFLTIFIPITAVSLYFQILREMEIDKPYNSVPYEEKIIYYFYAEVAGVLILLILLEPLFRRLYKRWFSLPVE